MVKLIPSQNVILGQKTMGSEETTVALLWERMSFSSFFRKNHLLKYRVSTSSFVQSVWCLDGKKTRAGESGVNHWLGHVVANMRHLCPLWHHKVLLQQLLLCCSGGFLKKKKKKIQSKQRLDFCHIWEVLWQPKSHESLSCEFYKIAATNKRRHKESSSLAKTRSLTIHSITLFFCNSQLFKVWKVYSKQQQHLQEETVHRVTASFLSCQSTHTLTCPLWNPTLSADMKAKVHFSHCQTPCISNVAFEVTRDPP